MKNKKQKTSQEEQQAKQAFVISGGQKLEETTVEEELNRIIASFLEAYPSHLKEGIQQRLQLAFALKDLKDFPHLQEQWVRVLPNGCRVGRRWNVVKEFYG
mmetsp:Transcript_32971/g.50439  ORF Transcript_32971/g.50439 Transcript_32971/m.50439 type:complete len:101 (-) Transcript_32971:41-343(-)